MQQAIKQAMKIIEEFEGFHGKAYICPAGIPTIGYGFTTAGIPTIVPFMLQGHMDVPTADEFLYAQCEKLANSILDTDNYGIVANSFTANQLAALISFAFNLGTTRLYKSTLWKVINKNKVDYANIEKEFNKWVNAGSKRLNGLVRRRRAEFKLYKGELKYD